MMGGIDKEKREEENETGPTREFQWMLITEDILPVDIGICQPPF